MVRVGFEEDHLGVLAAQLDDRARLRVERLDSGGSGDHLLHEGGAAGLSDGHRARTRHREQETPARKRLFDRAQRCGGAGCLVGMMPLVARVQNGMRCGVDHNGLDGGGSHIEAEQQRCGGGIGRTGSVLDIGHKAKTWATL